MLGHSQVYFRQQHMLLQSNKGSGDLIFIVNLNILVKTVY